MVTSLCIEELRHDHLCLKCIYTICVIWVQNIHIKGTLSGCFATRGQRFKLQRHSLQVFPVFTPPPPPPFFFFFSRSVVLCPPTYGNTSLLIHQLVAHFVCLLFVAGQVVNPVLLHKKKKKLYHFQPQHMEAENHANKKREGISQVVGCEMLKASRERGWAAQLDEILGSSLWSAIFKLQLFFFPLWMYSPHLLSHGTSRLVTTNDRQIGNVCPLVFLTVCYRVYAHILCLGYSSGALTLMRHCVRGAGPKYNQVKSWHLKHFPIPGTKLLSDFSSKSPAIIWPGVWCEKRRSGAEKRSFQLLFHLLCEMGLETVWGEKRGLWWW